MNARIRNLWDSVNGSFWFLPSLMTVAAGLLSFVLVALDQALANKLDFFFGYSRGPEGARSLLSTVAGSVIGVAGVVFSITIAVLSLASNQFGPRLLRNFMRDRGSQLVLGTFIATFLYCLLVLRTVNGSQDSSFVPHISVTFGLVLAVASLGVFIYFVHHVATIIQAESVVNNVSEELRQSINHLFPQKLGEAPPSEIQGQVEEKDLPANFNEQSLPVKALKEGYLQAVDTTKLMALANQHNLICQLNCRPGQFIIKGMSLLRAWPQNKVDEKVSEKLCSAFILGSFRSATQDVEFAINQLVEIALRALSPGVNDPFTAINCIDRLGANLNLLGEREMPFAYRYQDTGELRIITQSVTKPELVEQAFGQIRKAASSSVAVLIYMLELISKLVRNIADREVQLALLKQASLIEQATNKGSIEEADRTKIVQCYQTVLNYVTFESSK